MFNEVEKIEDRLKTADGSFFKIKFPLLSKESILSYDRRFKPEIN